MFVNPVDEHLDQLDESLKKLKARYDLFFAGAVKLPPIVERRRIEATIHELSKQNIRDNARRFRLNTLVSRFNQFRELWGRKMREREEGPTDYRRRREALLGPRAEPEAVEKPAPRPVTSDGPHPYVQISAVSNGDALKQLQAQINDANRQVGVPREMTIDQVRSMVSKQMEALVQKFGVSTFAMRVDVVDGKVKLKAKPLQNHL